ncbi:MAG TPA: hypothetical protein VJV39_22335 [Dongiaceae bacterium]|nr:hypothetical protein [Dongiaceae bacterium]
MTRIAIITHKFDRFLRRSYLLSGILNEVEQAGIEVEVTHGHRQFVRADLAILHVSSTIISAEYVALAKRYPRTLNLAVNDVRKSRISGAALRRDENWDGPVIVKTELNSHGGAERFHNCLAAKRGKRLPYPALAEKSGYEIFERAADVPDAIWQDRALAVERFLPERDPRGYALRTWVFMGSRETCSRCIALKPIVKGAGIIARELIAVPDELRMIRRQLGFDYGKFDYVEHDGLPVLLDANPTPRIPPSFADVLSRSAKQLAPGLLELLQEADGSGWFSRVARRFRI